jgi:hypothetical protein
MTSIQQHPDMYRITYALVQAGLHVYGTAATSDTITIDLGHIDEYGDVSMQWTRATGWAWTVTEPDGQIDTANLYGVSESADADPDQVAWAMAKCMTYLEETGESLQVVRTLARIVGVPALRQQNLDAAKAGKPQRHLSPQIGYSQAPLPLT